MKKYIFFREDKRLAPAKLIFSKTGDRDYPAEKCWAYRGKVGHVGGEAGQTVNLNSDCMNMGTVLHLVMHSLGRVLRNKLREGNQHFHNFRCKHA